MPKFSAFTPFGMLAFSSKPSHAEAIYRTLIDGDGDTFDVTGNQDDRRYAAAMVLASAQYQLDRAGNNRSPKRATELLGLLERDFRVVTAPNATLPERRAILTARALVTRGARFESVQAALFALLGSDLIAYDTTSVVDAVALPSVPGSVGVFARPGTQKKTLQFPKAVSIIGEPITIAYELIGDSADPINGEQFCVDPDPRRNIENVTVSDVGNGMLTATFTRSHEPGTVATRPHPFWISSKRYARVLVSVAAAKDPETRRQINEIMARMARGVSQWCIAHNAGVFTSDDPVLGLTDCTLVS